MACAICDSGEPSGWLSNALPGITEPAWDEHDRYRNPSPLGWHIPPPGLVRENSTCSSMGSEPLFLAEAYGTSFCANLDGTVTVSTADQHAARIHLESNEPAFLVTEYQLQHELSEMQLSEGARRILQEDNAGGKSEVSESLSFEVLRLLFGGVFLLGKTEMELQYARPSAITDYSATLGDIKVGVSVTRALKFDLLNDRHRPKRFTGYFSRWDAYRLLYKKLRGIIISSQNVSPQDAWSKQVLHVWAQSRRVASKLECVYNQYISPSLKSNTVVVITVAEGPMSAAIFTNQAPVLAADIADVQGDLPADIRTALIAESLR